MKNLLQILENQRTVYENLHNAANILEEQKENIKSYEESLIKINKCIRIINQ
jgi:hypothetical protein